MRTCFKLPSVGGGGGGQKLTIMKKSKIKLNFASFSDAELEARSFGIIAAMTGNPHFTAPSPSLDDLSNSLKLFSDALALAKTGDRVKAVYKNQLRENLDNLLTKLATYCTYIAQGDRFILASSGFSLTAEVNATKILGAPQNFSVEVGRTNGEALVYVNPVANAKSYLFRWGTAPIANDTWMHTVSSQPRLTIPGLLSATTYSFQIGAVGSKGQLVFTDIISKLVL